MKIIIANNYYYLRGGSERVFFDEKELLERYGHAVAPFSRYCGRNERSDYVGFYPPDLAYEGGTFLKKASASLKLIYSPECGRRFGNLLDSFRPNVVHCHNIYGRLTSSVIDAAKKSRVPVLMTLHDYKLICPSYLMLLNGLVCDKCRGGKFYNCLLTRCHKGSFVSSSIYTFESYFSALFNKYEYISFFICPSKFSLKKHIEAGVPEEKLIHIPNFINKTTFEPNYSDTNYILFVGRLSKEKGVLTLLRAVKGFDILVRIVGDGPIRDECVDYAKKNGLNNVVFEGHKSGIELRELFRNAAFLVFPSEWYENAPMTILEAFAHGKPVVGARIGGIPEMVVDGETGLLFETGDHDELREKIRELSQNPSMAEDMGRKARWKVESEHNAQRHYSLLMEVYDSALSGVDD